MQDGRIAQARGDVHGATRAFDAVLAQQPGHPVALNGLGMLALQAKAYEDARARFFAASSADPHASAILINLATACRHLADADGERAALMRALALNATDFIANLRLAQLYERSGAHRDAHQYWQLALGLAAQLEAVPPRLADELAHGRAYIDARQTALASDIDAALGQQRAALDPTSQRRFAACTEIMLGRRRAFQNACHGLFYPFLPADEFFDRAHFPWMPALETQTAAIRAELQALLDQRAAALRPYVAQPAGTPANIWSPLDQSLDWGALFLWEFGAPNQELLAQCPQTVAALAQVPLAHILKRGPSVFFSLLKPHTHIPPHTGVTNIRTIIHLPLIVPDQCRFRVGGETRTWIEGEAFAFDDTIEHEAHNDSDQLRAVLIFDVWNPHLTPQECDLLARMFAVIENEPARDARV